MSIMNMVRTDFGIEGTTRFEMFDKDIKVMMDESVSIDYAEKCVSHLNSLNNYLIENLCEASLKYCFEFSDDIGENVPEMMEKAEILKYVYPRTLIIDKPKDQSKIGYHMECECEWEIEHGLEFTILENRLLYLGDFNSVWPWEPIEYYESKSWNYAFGKPDIYDEELQSKLLKLLK